MGHGKVLAQSLVPFVRQHKELLVRVGIMQQLHTLFLKGFADGHSLAVGLGSQGKVQAVAGAVLAVQQGQELLTQQAALGQHAAVLLDGIAEILFQRVIGDDHGLAKQCAALGAAQVEHIAQGGVVLQGQVVGFAHQAVGHAGAVHKQVQPQLIAGGRDVGQLGLGVERAHLGGVGDVDHTGLHLMLVAGVGAVFFHRVADLPCRDLAVFIGQGQALVAGGFYCAGLVYMDMAAVGAQHTLPGLEGRIDDRQVGLGRTYKKVHGGIRGVAQGADLVRSGGAIAVLAIAGGLVKVGLLHQFQHRGGSAFAVITFKTKHKSSPFLTFSLFFIITPECTSCNPAKLQV